MTWGQREVAAGALVCTSTFGQVIICQDPVGQVDTQGVWFEPFYPSCSPKNSTGSEDAVGVSCQRWWWEETGCGQEEGKLNRVSPAMQGRKEKTASDPQGTKRCSGQQASSKGSGGPCSPPPSFPSPCQRAGIGMSEVEGCVRG